MVNKLWFNKWLKALESGEYKQGRYRLHTVNGEDRFCCLGVACDITKNKLNLKTEVKKIDWSSKGSVYYNAVDTTFPFEVAELFGVETDPIVTYKGVKNCVSQLNDTGVKFKTIARLLREEYL